MSLALAPGQPSRRPTAGCQPCLGCWHRSKDHFAPPQQFFEGWSGLHSCFQFSGGHRNEIRARTTQSSLGVTISPASKIWRGNSSPLSSRPLGRSWDRHTRANYHWPVASRGWLCPLHVSRAQWPGQKYMGYFGSPQTRGAFCL